MDSGAKTGSDSATQGGRECATAGAGGGKSQEKGEDSYLLSPESPTTADTRGDGGSTPSTSVLPPGVGLTPSEAPTPNTPINSPEVDVNLSNLDAPPYAFPHLNWVDTENSSFITTAPRYETLPSFAKTRTTTR